MSLLSYLNFLYLNLRFLKHQYQFPITITDAYDYQLLGRFFLPYNFGSFDPFKARSVKNCKEEKAEAGEGEEERKEWIHSLLHGYTPEPKRHSTGNHLLGLYPSTVVPGQGLSLSHTGSGDIPDPEYCLPSLKQKGVCIKTHLIIE